ncbi:hypothetical protein [Streptomyces sp. NPDC046925]|uniref:hypothetical protein n=1 Tax=Streptomyces sp. NPDC046925 TaxID=3155375 RepID=UPI00340C3FBD
MELASLIVAIFAALISLLAGYAAWRANRPKPKMAGLITMGWRQEVAMNVVGEMCGDAIGLHVILTNASSHPIHPLHFELEVSTGGVWLKGKRMQNYQTTLPELRFSGYAASLDYSHLVDWPPRAVNHGAPLMGFIYYVVPGLAPSAVIKEYRITVTDVFGGAITFKKSQFDLDAYHGREGSHTTLELLTQAGVPVRRV